VIKRRERIKETGRAERRKAVKIAKKRKE